ncbi:translation initiation factor IF-2 isoform X2 [Culex quinquefasciatus]|uniref:translation initiation factor IF-2 isoform X2 n=1 Tax=Culex quinquefasciatus TaxID=7176 RepID=UPI0018E3C485|nr:translation initiation factor IF-2 isoform X2 [Culex quinquefasciatus]XP_039437398.1 translation initiation factor IF-2-like isoform X2 [Culex pipiens pallens]
MELSRIKVLYGGLILQLLFTIAVPLPYNKYGRQCSDIGCLSSQVCVMAYDSCSLSQREGNDCGRYPTCKKNTEAGLAADSNTDLYSNTPDRPKPGASAPSDDDVLASLGLNPSQPIPNNRPSGNNNGGHNPYQNPYPTLPPRQPAQPAQPQYPGGGSNYYGGGGGGTGGSSHYGGNRGQFDGAGGNIVVPSPKPPTPAGGGGGGFFSGIFGGIQNAVSNAVKQQVGTYINQRLGIGPAAGGQAGGAGGLGGLLDARNFIDQKKFGGLFAEKPAAGNSGSSGSSSGTSGGNPYPVTVDQRPIQSVVGQQQYASRSSEQSSQYGQRKPQQQGTPAPYGWKLD